MTVRAFRSPTTLRQPAGALLFTLLVLSVLCARLGGPPRAADHSGGPTVAQMHQKAEGLDLTPAECRFETVGWQSSMSAALALARETRRPIFLFTMDGELDGRC